MSTSYSPPTPASTMDDDRQQHQPLHPLSPTEQLDLLEQSRLRLEYLILERRWRLVLPGGERSIQAATSPGLLLSAYAHVKGWQGRLWQPGQEESGRDELLVSTIRTSRLSVVPDGGRWKVWDTRHEARGGTVREALRRWLHLGLMEVAS